MMLSAKYVPVFRLPAFGLFILAFGLLVGCSGEDPPEQSLTSFSTDEIASHIATLAADEFEGRAPASAGEAKTIGYLGSEFAELMLEPGNGDSYLQEVPLMAITTRPDAALVVDGPRGPQTFRYGQDYIAWTKRVVETISLDLSEMVFVGYGIVAPEYGWNDYEGLDVAGKTVVMLVNDPGFATQNPDLFNGNAMTYYGRWTYKFEEAARQGAAGALVIHEQAPAGYPWEVVSGSWSGPQFDLLADDGNQSRCQVEGWISADAARSLFEVGGLDFDSTKTLAQTPDFTPVPLNQTASITLHNTIEESTSYNVIARLPGRTRPDEVILYTAHWDHFGRDPSLTGDQIYNGAADNATGVAGMLAIARAFAVSETPPERSVVFLAVTAEEQGLLGSRYYAEHPLYPTSQTVANINMDVFHPFGRMNDVTVIGYGNSELDDYVDDAAAAQDRTVRPDPQPEKGFYYRSDHFNFAKLGVPALYLDSGVDNAEHGEAWTLERLNEYENERYHKVTDEYDPSWDLSGMVEDLKLLFRIGYRLANESSFPNWREGNEFKAARDADRGDRAGS